MKTEDKIYHVACAIPVVQTFVGGAFVVKNIIGIIKDIVMRCLFPNYINDNLKVRVELQTKIKFLNTWKDTNIKLTTNNSGSAEDISLATEGRECIHEKLRKMGLFFPIPDSIKNKCSIGTPLVMEEKLTDAYLSSALSHCEGKHKDLLSSNFIWKPVPALTRISNLATNIISMIPRYRIGTVYNLGVLAYHTFLKKN